MGTSKRPNISGDKRIVKIIIIKIQKMSSVIKNTITDTIKR